MARKKSEVNPYDRAELEFYNKNGRLPGNYGPFASSRDLNDQAEVRSRGQQYLNTPKDVLDKKTSTPAKTKTPAAKAKFGSPTRKKKDIEPDLNTVADQVNRTPMAKRYPKAQPVPGTEIGPNREYLGPKFRDPTALKKASNSARKRFADDQAFEKKTDILRGGRSAGAVPNPQMTGVEVRKGKGGPPTKVVTAKVPAGAKSNIMGPAVPAKKTKRRIG